MVWTKWSYMDHWVTETPQGPQPPSFNRAYMDRYVKQLSALGFTGFDTFFFVGASPSSIAYEYMDLLPKIMFVILPAFALLL